MRWRYWLIELPTTITDIGLAWYRLYFMVVIWIAALVGPAMVLSVLILYVFGVRWGW